MMNRVDVEVWNWK